MLNLRLGIRFPERLLAAREAVGWTQEDLAEESGISRITVSRLENGSGTISDDTLDAICDALDIEDRFIFAREDNEPPQPDPARKRKTYTGTAKNNFDVGEGFPERLRRLRIHLAKETQAGLAEAIDVKPLTVSRWENGTVLPTPENFYRLVRYFRVDPSWLYGSEDQEGRLKDVLKHG